MEGALSWASVSLTAARRAPSVPGLGSGPPGMPVALRWPGDGPHGVRCGDAADGGECFAHSGLSVQEPGEVVLPVLLAGHVGVGGVEGKFIGQAALVARDRLAKG